MIDYDTHQLPPLTGADHTGFHLVHHAHLGANWDVWGKRVARYWDALQESVMLATYGTRDLASWWSKLSTRMDVFPPANQELRAELAHLIGTGDDTAVLKGLRGKASTFVLYQRVISDQRRTEWRARNEEPAEPTEQQGGLF